MPALRTALHLAASVVLLVAVDIYYARAGLWPMFYPPPAEHAHPEESRRA